MGDSRGQIGQDAASVYEEFFVPALFAEWAPRVARALEPVGPGRALDVACGTGVLGRELARRLGAERVVGLDCNEGMLAVAARLAPEVEWRAGRAEALSFDDGELAAVGSQFGLMFFEDRAKAVSEMWRVLAPGGRLAVAVWGPLAETPGYQAMVELLERLFGAAIADELRAPFSLGDPAALSALFERAGVAGAEVRTEVGVARFESVDAWVHTDVRGWTLADRIDEAQYALLRREAPRALAAHQTRGGAVEFASPAHIVTAQKP